MRELTQFRVRTPLGTLVASGSADIDHPGIWIELFRRGAEKGAPLALIEYTDDDVYDDINGPQLVARTWGDVCDEECSETVCYTRVEDFFALRE